MTCVILFTNRVILLGAKSNPASPTTSGKEVALELITGVPNCIASVELSHLLIWVCHWFTGP